MGDRNRLTITLPPVVMERLSQLAEQYGISRSALIAIAITEKFDREKGGTDA